MDLWSQLLLPQMPKSSETFLNQYGHGLQTGITETWVVGRKKKSRMSNQHVTMESTDMESQVLTETHAAKFHNLFPEEGVITDYWEERKHR